MRTKEEIYKELRDVDALHTEAVKAELALKIKICRLHDELRDVCIEEQIPGYIIRDKMTGEKVRTSDGIF